MSEFGTDSLTPNNQDDNATLWRKVAYWLSVKAGTEAPMNVQDEHYYLYQAAQSASQIP